MTTLSTENENDLINLIEKEKIWWPPKVAQHYWQHDRVRERERGTCIENQLPNARHNSMGWLLLLVAYFRCTASLYTFSPMHSPGLSLSAHAQSLNSLCYRRFSLFSLLPIFVGLLFGWGLIQCDFGHSINVFRVQWPIWISSALIFVRSLRVNSILCDWDSEFELKLFVISLAVFIFLKGKWGSENLWLIFTIEIYFHFPIIGLLFIRIVCSGVSISLRRIFQRFDKWRSAIFINILSSVLRVKQKRAINVDHDLCIFSGANLTPIVDFRPVNETNLMAEISRFDYYQHGMAIMAFVNVGFRSNCRLQQAQSLSDSCVIFRPVYETNK